MRIRKRGGSFQTKDGITLDIFVWKKRCAPVLFCYSIEGIYGPGHNSFFTDAQGNLMIAYHAEDALEHHLRCGAIHRVYFNIHGEPVFDLSAQRDFGSCACQGGDGSYCGLKKRPASPARMGVKRAVFSL